MEEREEFLIDLGGLLKVLFQKSGILALSALLGALAVLVGTFLLAAPQYQSTVMIYVNTTQSAKDLADSFDVIVKMRETLMEVIRQTEIDTNHDALQKRIEVVSVKQTDFFQITVSGPDPYESQRIAEAIGQLLPDRVAQIMEGTSVKVVGQPIPAARPSSPSYPNSALAGGAMGLLLGIGTVLWMHFFPLKKKWENLPKTDL